MKLRVLQIAALGAVTEAGNVRVTTAAGEAIHLKKVLIENKEPSVGDFMIVTDKEYTQRTKRDSEGDVMYEEDGVTPQVEPHNWTRTEATYVGDELTCYDLADEEALSAEKRKLRIEERTEEFRAARKLKAPAKAVKAETADEKEVVE